VVDDESALLNLTNEILTLHGFKVFCAGNGKEALDVLQHETIDILLTDIIMPEMDGYELANILKEKYPEIKIQLISGFPDEDGRLVHDKNLQENIIAKPFNSNALVQRIHVLLNM